MRIIKHNLIFFFTLVVTFALITSCEDKKDDDDNNQNALVGTWELTKTTVDIEGFGTFTINADEDNNDNLVISDDGTFSSTGEDEGESFSGNGTWTATNDKATFIGDGHTTVADYSISGSTLTISFSETEGGMTATITQEYEKQ